MTERIFVPIDVAEGKDFVLVNGKCYERVGPSNTPPDTQSVHVEYESCDDCLNRPICCMCWLDGFPTDGSFLITEPGGNGKSYQWDPALGLNSENYCSELVRSKDHWCLGDTIKVTLNVTNIGPETGEGGTDVRLSFEAQQFPNVSPGCFEIVDHTPGENFLIAGPANTVIVTWPELNLAVGASKSFFMEVLWRECCPTLNNEILTEFQSLAARGSGWNHNFQWLNLDPDGTRCE